MLRRGGVRNSTDRTDLCEKLVWHTQHPHRHKRDLRLGLDNEYSLNMRIHPLAAVWANAAWDRALRQMEARQSRCFELLGVLSDTALVEDVAFEERSIRPAY